LAIRPGLLLALLVAFAMLVAAGACGGGDSDSPAPTFSPDSTMGRIRAAGKLTVGVKFDQPGFGLRNFATGEVEGFDVALAREIGAALGLEADQVVFEEAQTANRIPYLQDGKVDIVVATMTITDERKAQIDFSRPYFLAGQSILVKKDNDAIRGIDDLAGRSVCSVQGSTSEKNLLAKAPQAKLQSVSTYASCVSGLKDGHYEAVSTDDIILAGFAAADHSLKLVGGQFTQEPYGIGVKKGREDLVQFIDALIAQWLEDGTWDEIYKEYLGDVEGLPSAEEARATLPGAG